MPRRTRTAAVRASRDTAPARGPQRRHPGSARPSKVISLAFPGRKPPVARLIGHTWSTDTDSRKTVCANRSPEHTLASRMTRSMSTCTRPWPEVPYLNRDTDQCQTPCAVIGLLHRRSYGPVMSGLDDHHARLKFVTDRNRMVSRPVATIDEMEQFENAPESSRAESVNKLKVGAVGLFGVLFMAVSQRRADHRDDRQRAHRASGTATASTRRVGSCSPPSCSPCSPSVSSSMAQLHHDGRGVLRLHQPRARPDLGDGLGLCSPRWRTSCSRAR